MKNETILADFQGNLGEAGTEKEHWKGGAGFCRVDGDYLYKTGSDSGDAKLWKDFYRGGSPGAIKYLRQL